MKQKILHVIKTLELGGAETNLCNLLQAFDPAKFEHHVAYSFGGEIEENLKKIPHVKLYKYSRGKHKIASLHTLFIIARLRSYMKREHISVVHTHNFNAHFWAVYAAKLAGVKVVEHVHDFRYFEIKELEKRRGVANLNRHIGKFKGLSDIVVVLTEQNREFLVKNGFYKQNKVRIIPNGISLRNNVRSDRKEVMSEFKIDEHSLLVLTASRMAPTKNIELVVRIAPEVLRQVPDAVFLIAGNGELLDSLKKEAAEKNVADRVRFVGFHADIHRLLGASDLFLLPSFLELHSISILEAMSMGVPCVVSSGVGCNNETFDSWKNGVLADPYDAPSWSNAVVKLLQDEALRKNMGKSGLELCKARFDIRKTAAQFEALYEELCVE